MRTGGRACPFFAQLPSRSIEAGLALPTGLWLYEPLDIIWVTLTFPQPMNTSLEMASGDFLLEYTGGSRSSSTPFQWLSSTQLKIKFSSIMSFSPPMLLSFLNYSGNLKTASGVAYEAWSDLLLSAS